MNAIQADSDRNMSYSAFLCSLSRQHCFPFQFPKALGRFATSIRHDGTASTFNAFPTDAIQFEDAKASESDGSRSFKLSLCVTVKISLMIT
jgi:hypothetical protein